MDTLFTIIFFVSFFTLIVGLIRPKAFAPIFRGKTTRKGILYVFGSLFLISIVVISAISPPAQEIEPEQTTPPESIETQLLDQNPVLEGVVEDESEPVETKNIQPEPQPSTPPPDQNDHISPPTLQKNTEQQLYSVIKVIDGDTISVNINGTTETLRLIGIDTPETVDPRKPVQCFGIEASNKAKELLNGKRVSLEADVTQGERGRYDRLLRYVFLEDGTDFQDYMIRNGYAHEYTYNLPYKYQTQFKQAEDEARLNKRGLWADDACEEETTPEQISEPVVINGQDYDCSYNKYNCGDFQTHDEAQAVFEYCGGIDNDVHRLDGSDNDGLACESLP